MNSESTNIIYRFFNFMRNEIWFIKSEDLRFTERWLYAGLKIVAIVYFGLTKNRVSLLASALSFISVLSLVPLFAFLVSVAKAINAQEKLLVATEGHLTALPVQVQTQIKHVYEIITQTDFTALGFIGLLIFFYAIIRVMSHIENTFNTIWGVKESRPFTKKISDYLVAITLGPILVVLHSTFVATLLSPKLTDFIQDHADPVFRVYEFGVGLGGTFGIALALAFVYLHFPNTKVKISAAAISGIFAGIIWYLLQWAFVKFQFLLLGYNPIYGTFAAVPVFFTWLYLNWIVVILGAELSFAIQNYRTYTMLDPAGEMSFSNRVRLAYLLVWQICQRFIDGSEPWKSELFKTNNEISIGIVKDILNKLEYNEIIYKVQNDRYVPASAPKNLTFRSVFIALFGKEEEKLFFHFTAEEKNIIQEFDQEQGLFMENLTKQTFAAAGSKSDTPE